MKDEIDHPILSTRLKSRLSSLWVKVIEMLSLVNVSTASAQNMLYDAKFKQEECHPDEAESWEDFLLVLSEDDAVVKDNELHVQPMFLSFPAILQSKLLYLIHQNSVKISNDQLSVFVSKLESVHNSLSAWVKDGVRRLRHVLDTEHTLEDNVALPTKPNSYTFKATSQKLMNNLLLNIAHKRQKDISPASSKVVLNISAHSSPFKQQNSSASNLDQQKVVDVIVIDDEEEGADNAVKHKANVCNREVRSKAIVSDDLNAQQTNSENISTTSVHTASDIDNTTKGGRKRKASEMNINEEDNGDNSNDQQNLKLLKSKTGSVGIGADCEEKPGCDSTVDSSLSFNNGAKEAEPMVGGCASILSDDIKANLQKLREACGGDKKSAGFDAGKLKFLLELSPSQMTSACKFLNLGDQTDENLASLCDVLPWSELEQSCASALLAGCFYHKLLTLCTEASQMLLSAMTFALKDQPNVLISLIVDVIHQTTENASQCQLLATLCKKSLSKESVCHLIRQLSAHTDDKVTEDVCMILQAAVDTRADLDSTTLTSLLGVLYKGSNRLASSPKFGKCLMACLTKYGKKMTPENLVTYSSMVDVHGSNFKASLGAVLKRLNK